MPRAEDFYNLDNTTLKPSHGRRNEERRGETNRGEEQNETLHLDCLLLPPSASLCPDVHVHRGTSFTNNG
ncbi:hypothetical protein DPEC_G00052440 [Dallia pectoralis]|uniref:Uncharacterized protein n=1 Tax=Dallia pectoralis TaxID=75939 RepID=A0ACC2HCX0_DALPE|nr:hypothetical protein DPEC_G00052440 [Dallia pectoralis]